MENQLKFISKKEVFNKKIELPEDSGIYQFYDVHEKLLYVGKAKNLKNRVSSYLNKGVNKKASLLRNQIRYLELIITKTESDALILEQSLIRKKKPPFNVQFRDDKSYPMIHISSNKKFPEIYVSRKKQKEGSSYGPYANVNAMRKNIEIIQKVFQIRNCKDVNFRNRSRPCIEHQIGKCSAPCVGLISEKEYKENVEEAKNFLDGNNKSILESFYKKMDDYSNRQDYERAKLYRDKINAIRDTQKNQSILTLYEDIDVISMSSDSFSICLSLVQIRDGWISATKNFFPETKNMFSNEDLLDKFITSYYFESPEKKINLLTNYKVSPEIIKNLKEIDKNINFIRTNNKNKFLLEIAKSQSTDRLKRKDFYDWIAPAFENLKKRLDLKSLDKIEAFDISHISGSNVTASCIVFSDKGPEKKEYRSMNIKNDKNDDYIALAEAISRRLNSLKKRSLSFPDLFLIDGGKGQLNKIRKELENRKIKNIKLVSVSKGENRNEKYDKLHIDFPLREVELEDWKDVSKLIQFMRNESHRFAIYKHKARRAKSFTSSDLDSIPSIGLVLKKELIRHFGGIKRLKEAQLEDLVKVDGVGEKKAFLIQKHLQ
ncbi:MAG: excinuclease ABC subunit UvrC [Rickettsiales bacterium TMED289]|nr:MAG: excinuclease ABC subunit UvrC [Rickettsiales bacterium TMED289]|tara:strand:+ start:278 stop:2083 length:1806 start_codon:yes stop_codon:yes gene_type:complete